VAALDAWLCFEDEAGFSTTPPTARTWARRGRTPVIRVRGPSQRRFSIAALACYKHGERSRLIYRPKRHADHKRGGRRSLTWTEYRNLLIAAHRQLGAPIVLVDQDPSAGLPPGVGYWRRRDPLQPHRRLRRTDSPCPEPRRLPGPAHHHHPRPPEADGPAA
jgi:hypothetical protein